jgi:hypothetical protein
MVRGYLSARYLGSLGLATIDKLLPNTQQQILASGSHNEPIRLWDAKKGEYLKMFRPDLLYDGMHITGITGLTKDRSRPLTPSNIFNYMSFGRINMSKTKRQNLEIIRSRLQVRSLPSKFENLPANTLMLFADRPDLDLVIQIIIEQNNTIKSANGRRLVAENKVELILLKLKDSIDFTKSGIASLWLKLFGKATKADDEFLREIGATSNESVKEDLDKMENIVSDASCVVQGYKEKIDQLNKKNNSN